MFGYRRSTDLFPLKLLPDILVRTAWQMNLEDAAAEEKAFIFQYYRSPLSYRKPVYGGGSVICLKLEKSAKYIVLARMDLSFPSLTSNVEFYVLEYCTQH